MADIGAVASKIREKLRFDKGTSASQFTPSPFINSVEYMAQLFEDSTISDTGTGNELQQRLGTMLAASANGGGQSSVVHFAGIFYNCSDGGFRPEFRDPWPGASNNQVGHFMTAVDFGYRPDYVYTQVWGYLKYLLVAYWPAPGVPSNESFCIDLIVGHEQVADDATFVNARQFSSPSNSDILNFYHAVLNVAVTTPPNLTRSRSDLAAIPIGTGRGNSIQDLHLSLYGYGLGRFIRNGNLSARSDAARWIRSCLGN